MEVLLGFPGDKEFVNSFREGTKVLIVRRGGNKDGRYLEAATYGMGGWRVILLISEGRGGWGWHKFAGELRKEKNTSFLLQWGVGVSLHFGRRRWVGRRRGQG
jgi:hypothetical protein